MINTPHMDQVFFACVCTDENGTGGTCDVQVLKGVICAYEEDEHGNEVPLWGYGAETVGDPLPTAVRADDPERLERLEADAVRVLEENGWTVTGDWDLTDNALYARVHQAAGSM